MTALTVSGSAAPQQIAGNSSPSTLIRNMDVTARLYVGRDSNTSPANYDMQLEAGAAYNTPPGPVYVATDAGVSCAIIYSQASSGLVTPSPSTVDATIKGKPNVAIPDGVAINGGVTVNGSVGVSGNVGIVGNVGVAGNVNVQGSVNAFGQNAHTFVTSQSPLVGTSGNYVLSNFHDVSAFQSIIVRAAGGGTQSSNAVGLVQLVWYDIGGNFITAEHACYWIEGSCSWITSVKGAYVTIQFYNLDGGGAHVMTGYFSKSTIQLDEYFIGFAPGNIVKRAGGSGTITGAVFDPVYGANFLTANIGANGSAIYNLSNLSRKASYNYVQNGANMQLELRSAINGGDVALVTLANSLGNNVGTIEIPRGALYAVATAGNTAGQSFGLSLMYERF